MLMNFCYYAWVALSVDCSLRAEYTVDMTLQATTKLEISCI